MISGESAQQTSVKLYQILILALEVPTTFQPRYKHLLHGMVKHDPKWSRCAIRAFRRSSRRQGSIVCLEIFNKGRAEGVREVEDTENGQS